MEPNTVSPTPRPVGCHRLPQIPTMGNNIRTAQSKSSARLSLEPKPKLSLSENVVNAEDSTKTVKIWTDGDLEDKDSVPPSDKTASNLDPKTQLEESAADIEMDVNSESNGQVKVNGPNVEEIVCKDEVVEQSMATLPDDQEIVSQPKKRGRKPKAVKNTQPGNVQTKSKRKSKDSLVQMSEANEAKLPSDLGERVQSPLEKKKNTSMCEGAEENLAGQSPSFKQSIETQTNDEQGPMENSPMFAMEHIPRCVLIFPKEIPNEAQREKMMEIPSASFELEHPVIWNEGDLLWGRVTGHPYWPCMISPCPFTNLMTRIKSLIYQARMYHVQFFGNDCERGWLSESSLMEFKGKADFLEMASSKPKTQKKGKNSNPFKINPKREAEWNIAVEEAEDASELHVEDRVSQYTFDYVFLESDDGRKKTAPSTPSVRGKRKRKESLTGSPNESNRKKRKIQHKEESPLLYSLPSDKDPNSFDIYYSNHRDSTMAMHSDWDASAVFEHLKQKWSALSPPSSNKSPETSPVSGKRTKKPTMKLVESIVQARIHMDTAVTKLEVTSPRKRGRPKKHPQLPGNTQTTDVSSPLQEKADPELSSETSLNPTPKTKRLRKSSSFKDALLSPKLSNVTDSTQSPKTVIAATLSSRTSSQDSDSSLETKVKRVKESEPYQLEIFKLQSTSRIEKDHICCVCGLNEDLIECHGTCGQHFHRKCQPTTPQVCDDEFKCQECLSGIHSCFSCKVADESTKKCSVAQCGKYYHENCVKKLRLTRANGDNKSFICPLHACQTCAVDNIKNIKATKGGRLFRCLRCPTAYHSGDFCVAAGSKILGAGFIECADHFQPNKSLASHAHVNITWCFLCSKGGALICCESCPASYHAECVNVEKTPDEAWFCEECQAGRRPLYGNIVWIKVGNYRWWPGEVCHPRHVPLNIQEKSHQLGEFPVRFFGSHDFYWIHKGRVFLFEEGDKASREGSSKNLYKVYMRGVQEATDAFKEWKAVKERKEEQEQEKSDKKPSSFKFTKRNYPVGNVQVNIADVSEIPRCECKEDQEDPCGSDCLNRMMMYECHPAVCPAKENCNNQRFQKRQYANCEPSKSDRRGWGLRTMKDMKKGQFVMEYVGDLIDEEECKRRIEVAHENNITNFYMLTMDKNKIIDAGPRGNYSRFMNHSCCPNMETQKWMVNGDIRVGLFCLNDIPAGTELTFNYNLECLGNEKTACACGADNCSGFLGVRPKTAAAIANEKKMKDMKKKKRKKKIDPRKEHEDDCFRCGEGGELVMCDKSNCPKVYHLQCLNLSKPPTGRWSCPWHHCDECGKAATVLCSECPNSFCQAHTEGNIVKVAGCLLCDEHEEHIEDLTKSASLDRSTATAQDTVHTNGVGISNSDDGDAVTSDENSSSGKGATSDEGPREESEEKTEKESKKVAKRKSFKDILREDSNSRKKRNRKVPSPSPPIPEKVKGAQVDKGAVCVTELVSVKGNKKFKKVLNGAFGLDGSGSLDGRSQKNPSPLPLQNGRPEKVGIFLKKTAAARGGKAGKTCRTNARYKSQLLSIHPGAAASVKGNGLPPRLTGRGQEDSEDNDSISDLVIDIDVP